MTAARFLTVLTAGLALAAGVAVADEKAAPADQAPNVKVSFLNPEKYLDAGLYRDYGAKSREATMTELRKHFEKLGAKYLAPGQTLSIDVEDIDLAGRFEPWRADAYDIRFLTDATWPRITLRYKLEGAGGTVTSGEEVVRNMNYLMLQTRRDSGETLHHEKAMLDDWFKSRFVARQPSRS
ncbi:MAG: DUF3016 domain-containing protein [Rhodospirillaceae bacterium]|nr:DUF3016 domain-containing protein [Rhodospirillaceae bacterium]